MAPLKNKLKLKNKEKIFLISTYKQHNTKVNKVISNPNSSKPELESLCGAFVVVLGAIVVVLWGAFVVVVGIAVVVVTKSGRSSPK